MTTVTCPKCGFEQPKDMFCAKCGIQMDAFVPSRPSMGQRLLASTVFYGILLAVVFASAAYFLYTRSQKPDSEFSPNRVALTPGAAESPTPPQVGAAATSATPQTAGTQNLASNFASDLEAEDESPAASGSSKELASADKVAGPAAPPQTATPASELNSQLASARAMAPGDASRRQYRFEVLFYLVSREFADRLTEDSDTRFIVGSASSGIVPNYKTKLESADKSRGALERLASEDKNVGLNQTSVLFFGGRDSRTSESLGFFVDVTPIRQNEKNIDVRVNIRRTLPNPAGPDARPLVANFDDNFSIPFGSAAFIGGILPHDRDTANIDVLRNINVLRPMTEDNFVRQNSEFLILVVPSLTDSSSVQ